VSTANASPQSVKSRALGLLIALSDVYAIPTAIYILLRLFTGWRLWPVALLGNVIHLVLLPAVPLLILLLLLHRWRRAAVAGLSALAFIIWYGVFLVPKIAPQCADSCGSIRVLQYNIAEGRLTSGKLTAALRSAGADIITLEEVAPEQFAAMQASLADLYPYQVLAAPGGAGLLSRYPITRSEPLPNLPGRSYLRADIEIDGKPILVLVAHPQVAYFDASHASYSSRSTDAFRALAVMSQQGTPTILAGDFNMVDQSADYDLLSRSGLHDTFREAGWGFGWSYAASGAVPPMPTTPLLRIDYLWHTPDLRAIRSWMGPDWGSDHLPLFAEFTFSDASSP
jgi:vancomycin resistance protein VanJ